MTIKLIKDGGIKILSKESGLVRRLLKEGWSEVAKAKGVVKDVKSNKFAK